MDFGHGAECLCREGLVFAKVKPAKELKNCSAIFTQDEEGNVEQQCQEADIGEYNK